MLPRHQTIRIMDTNGVKMDTADEVWDIRIFPGQDANVESVTSILSSHAGTDRLNNKVHVFTCARWRSDKSCDSSANMYIVPDATVLHAKFLDQTRCLVLCDEALLLCDLGTYLLVSKTMI